MPYARRINKLLRHDDLSQTGIHDRKAMYCAPLLEYCIHQKHPEFEALPLPTKSYSQHFPLKTVELRYCTVSPLDGSITNDCRIYLRKVEFLPQLS